MGNRVEIFGDWRLDDGGLEYLPDHYWIAADRLGEKRHGKEKDGISDWALQIFNKIWCKPEDFFPALKRAIERHAPNAGIDWSATMRIVRKEAYAKVCWQEAERRLHPISPDNPLGIIDIGQLQTIRRLADHLISVAWVPRSTDGMKTS